MSIVDRTPVPAGPQVLLVSTYFPPHLGGVEVVAQNQARSLARAGYRVTVATTRDHPERPRRETVDGYEVIRLPARNLLERRTGIPYPIVGPAFCGALYGLVRRSDVVHVHDVLYQPPQLAALFSHLAAKPLIVSQNTGSVHHDARLVRAVEGVSVATAGRYIWSRARRVTAHNQLVYDHLTARGVPARRIVRVGNGIDTAAFSPAPAAGPARLRSRLGIPADRPVVLFVGRLVDQKGYPALLRAAGPEYHIVLAGPGTPPPDVPAGASCVGPVPRDDLVDLYRMADLLVSPSLGEVFPLVVQEAMACGLPVIATDDPRYAAFGVDRRLLRLVPPEPHALRAAILAVLADPETGRRMAQYGRRFAVEHFEWQRNQQRLLDLYREITEAGVTH
ncbi:MAG: D-inositol-3-phosphate glycosyltransferase [Actinoplanes sp.]|jgi:glycosyltransferase involved in cell wall biosynthesis|nr:D-inositol-3-phosphate glycosyltransferase [Actinoplanes sp.]